jgi:hypothetical protein
MSNYTITTDFGAKDSLPSSNDSKVVRGSEFTAEFTNIQTAVATKADTAGDTFTGAVNFSADVAVNTNTLFVDVSTAKVGIGTTSPAYPLDVTGSAQLSGGDLILRSDSTDADTQSIRFENVGDDDRSAYIRADFENNESGNGTGLAFGTNDSGQDGQTRMVLTRIGRVGIGTTSPDQTLHLYQGALKIESGAPRIYLTDVNHDSDYSILNDNGLFGIYDDTNTTYRLRIDASGNVGIGTNNPQRKLTVESEVRIQGTYPKLEFVDTDNNPDFTIIGGNAQLQIYDETNSATRMLIDSSGNLLVGKTSSGSTIEGAELNNSGSIFAVRDSNPAGVFDRKTTDGDVVQFRRDGTTVGSVSATSSATSYNTSSDERLKENIADSADAGSKVDAIQIRQFDWKADGSHQDYGVIAQELINVAPEAVSEGDTEEDMMGVDYSKLVPMLIKEVQSLRSRVAELENV